MSTLKSNKLNNRLNFGNIKIGTKLFGGFGVLLLIAGIAQFIGVRGLFTVDNQLSKILNLYDMIDAVGDAQGGSLRYIIYGDDSYNKQCVKDAENIIEATKTLRNKFELQENFAVADEITKNVQKYIQSNKEYQQAEIKKQTAIKDGTLAGINASSHAKEVFDIIVEYAWIVNDKSNAHKFNTLEKSLSALEEGRYLALTFISNSSEESYKKSINAINESAEYLRLASTLMKTEKAIKQITAALKNIDTYTSSLQIIHEKIIQQRKIQHEIKTDIGIIYANADKLATTIEQYAAEKEKKAVSFTILVIAISFILGIAIAWIITRKITKPLEEGVKFANSIANGDLTQDLHVDQKDEIGQLAKALKAMRNKLKEVANMVTAGSNGIRTATNEVNTSSQQLSNGANEQAAAVEEVSSTIDEITTNVQQSSENSRLAAEITQKAETNIQEVANLSKETVEANMVIAEKINVINKIAVQTNILALNASVEAARAGEHGRGFSVVASEVRKLAENSKKAADEIINITKLGLQKSELAGQKLQEVLPEIETSSKLSQEISASNAELSSGISQVNNAIQQLNSIAQISASSSEELASNAEEMSSQAEILNQTVAFFKVEKKDIRLHPSFNKQTKKAV